VAMMGTERKSKKEKELNLEFEFHSKGMSHYCHFILPIFLHHCCKLDFICENIFFVSDFTVNIARTHL